MKFGLSGKDAEAAFYLRNAVDHLIGANVFADSLEKAPRDPTVAFGPGERTFFFGFAGGKIMNASPGGCVFRERAVVVASSVIHIPVH